MKKFRWLFFAFVFLLALFSFKLTAIPKGVTVDEAAFGYNATLLSRTLHDENGRFLPIFVLSIHGQDWRQPVTQYLETIFVRVLGPSLFNIRLVSVVVAAASVIFIFYLGRDLLGKSGGLVTAAILATTPIFMIHSHLALDNINPVFFAIAWLYFLYIGEKTKKNFWLILSALSLGIGFYSYKGMRVYVPVWGIITSFYLMREYLVKRTKKVFKRQIKPLLSFDLTLAPFFLIIPVLEHFYSGAVLNHEKFIFEGVYKFLYPYLSSFDPAFLFIKGDSMLIHSTGWHGMFLLFSLPFFLAGISAWNKNAYWKLVIISFFLGPFLFGFFGSIDRASRMLSELPIYSLIAAAGFLWFWSKKGKIIPIILTLTLMINYFDFLKYYWGNYAKDTSHLYYGLDYWRDGFGVLNALSQKNNLLPYIDKTIVDQEDTAADFGRVIYFKNRPQTWDGNLTSLPKGSVLMTNNQDVKMERLSSIDNFVYYVKN